LNHVQKSGTMGTKKKGFTRCNDQRMNLTTFVHVSAETQGKKNRKQKQGPKIDNDMTKKSVCAKAIQTWETEQLKQE